MVERWYDRCRCFVFCVLLLGSRLIGGDNQELLKCQGYQSCLAQEGSQYENKSPRTSRRTGPPWTGEHDDVDDKVGHVALRELGSPPSGPAPIEKFR